MSRGIRAAISSAFHPRVIPKSTERTWYRMVTMASRRMDELIRKFGDRVRDWRDDASAAAVASERRGCSMMDVSYSTSTLDMYVSIDGRSSGTTV